MATSWKQAPRRSPIGCATSSASNEERQRSLVVASFFRDRNKIVQRRNNSNEVSDIATPLQRRLERVAELPRVLQRQADVGFSSMCLSGYNVRIADSSGWWQASRVLPVVFGPADE